MEKDLALLNNTSIDIRRFEYNFLSDKNVITTQLEALDHALGKLKIAQRQKMMMNDKYYQAFTSVRFDLQNVIKTLKDKRDPWKQQLTLLRDTIFGSKLKGMFDEDNKKQSKASRVFIKFVEGITCFASEKVYNIRDMIYHRNGSCSKNFDCVSTKNRAHRKSNTHLIEKCYIERMIYDHLWLHIQQIPQDIKHIEWLEKTRKAYVSCVPHGHIVIKIGQYKTMPEKITIEKYLDGVLIDVEIYAKKWNASIGSYDDLVICRKHKPMTKHVYTKNQTFNGETPWIHLQTSTPLQNFNS